MKIFKDRKEAGIELAKLLKKYKEHKNAIVIGLPRGGVVVAFEVSKALNLPVDVIAVAKIGAPNNPEYAIGAIAMNEVMLDQERVHSLNISDKYVEDEVAKKKTEVAGRLLKFRGTRSELIVTDKIIILVDDGMATGSTMEAALHALKKQRPKKVVIAVPVAPPETVEKFENLADEIVCVVTPQMMMSVGQFYSVFDQVEDDEVIKLLRI